MRAERETAVSLRSLLVEWLATAPEYGRAKAGELDDEALAELAALG